MDRASLEDFRVLSVSRESGQLAVDLEHSTDGRQAKVLAAGNLVEEVEYYTGHNVRGAHSDPGFPLDLIEVSEMGDGTLDLQGYLNNEPWYVWRIKADDVYVSFS